MSHSHAVWLGAWESILTHCGPWAVSFFTAISEYSVFLPWDQELSQSSGIFYMADRLVSVQKDPGQEPVGTGKENGLHYIFIDHRKIPPSLDYSINGADLILIKETVKSIFSNLEK